MLNTGKYFNKEFVVPQVDLCSVKKGIIYLDIDKINLEPDTATTYLVLADPIPSKQLFAIIHDMFKGKIPSVAGNATRRIVQVRLAMDRSMGINSTWKVTDRYAIAQSGVEVVRVYGLCGGYSVFDYAEALAKIIKELPQPADCIFLDGVLSNMLCDKYTWSDADRLPTAIGAEMGCAEVSIPTIITCAAYNKLPMSLIANADITFVVDNSAKKIVIEQLKAKPRRTMLGDYTFSGIEMTNVKKHYASISRNILNRDLV